MRKLLLVLLALMLGGTLAVACAGGAGGAAGARTPSGLYKASEAWASGASLDFQDGRVVYTGTLATRTYRYTLDGNSIRMENVANGAIDYAQYMPETDSVLYSGVTFVK